MVDNVPKHVAIIPDGNRRWAKEKGLVASAGYVRMGNYDILKTLFNKGKELGIEYFSIWGFSTENWKRDKKEIKIIIDLVLKLVDRFLENPKGEGFRFRHIGRKDNLPRELVDKMNRLEEKTKEIQGYCVNLFFDYGGRDEIVRAVHKIVESGGHLADVDEKTFASYLDTFGIPDPDLIIRTSGEKRISGFMLFQAAYSELYFCEKHFPEFKPEDLEIAVKDYSERKRRFGGD